MMVGKLEVVFYVRRLIVVKMEKQEKTMMRGMVLLVVAFVLALSVVSALSYSPGIKVYDEASWVGLGFSEGTPSITRGVVGYPDDSANGWLNTNEGTDQDNYFTPWGRIVANDSKNFTTLSWSLLDIKYENPSNGITSWVITTTDGTQYIFNKSANMSTGNFKEKLETNSSGSWQTSYSTLSSPLEGETFTYAWYLTEVRAINYVDNDANGADVGDYGGWQRYEYTTQNLQYRFPNSTDANEYFYYNFSRSGTYDYYKWRQYDYNVTLVYPTYVYSRVSNVSYVTADDRTDSKDKTGDTPYRLSEVVSRRTGDSEVLGKTKFTQDYSLAGGKLTLLNVTVEGADGGDLPSTNYFYEDNPSYSRFAYDLWGYYNGQTGNTNARGDDHSVGTSSVNAWTVTNVTLSSGGTIYYVYGSNYYDYEQDTSLGSTKSGAGIRLNATNVSDGIGQGIYTTYAYGGGVVNYDVNATNRRLDASEIVYLPDAYLEYENSTVDYGSFGQIKTYYVTSKDYPDSGCTGSLDCSYKRGGVSKTEVINATEDIIQTSEVGYNYIDEGGLFSNSRYRAGIVLVNNSNSTMYGVTLWTNYSYNDEYLLNMTQYYDLITTYEYAYENDCNGFVNDNRYGIISAVRTYNGSFPPHPNPSPNMTGFTEIVFDGCGFYPNRTQVWYDVDGDGYDTVEDRMIRLGNVTKWDVYGNVLTTVDYYNKEFNTKYDSEYNAYPIRGWNPEFGSDTVPAWNVTYNNRGLVVNVSGPNGETVSYVYDEFGRVTNVTAPGDDETTVDYVYHFAEPLQLSDLNSITVNTRAGDSDILIGVSYSDGLGRGRETLIENGAEDVISLVKFNERGVADESFTVFENDGYYSVDGTPSYVGSSTVDFSEDPMMVPESIDSIGPSEANSVVYHDGSYFVGEGTDEEGNVNKVYANKYGQIVKVTNTLSKDVTYEYDKYGNIKQVTDEIGFVYNSSYDNLGRITESASPDYGVTTYGYDDGFRLVNVTDEKGTVNYTYDDLGRVIYVNYSDTSFEYVYDAYSPVPADFNYPLGKLTKIKNEAQKVVYFYDEKGSIRIINTTVYDQGADDYIAEEEYSVEYDYDMAGRIVNFTDHKGVLHEYDYNALSQVEGIDYDGSDLVNYTYGERGVILAMSVLSKLDIFNLFDGFERLSGLLVLNSTTDVNFKYFDERDDKGRVTAQYDSSFPNNTVKMLNRTYDSESRMLGENSTNSYMNSQQYGYTYDDAGKVVGMSDKDSASTYVYYGDTNRIKTAGNYAFNYTDSGRISEVNNITTGAAIIDYTYDAMGRLTKVVTHQSEKLWHEGEVDYYYAVNGKVLKKVEMDVKLTGESPYNQTTLYYYDGGTVIGEKLVKTD